MNNTPAQSSQNLGKCLLCGSTSGFKCPPESSLREAICPSCGASRRQSDVAAVVLDTFLHTDRLPLKMATPELSQFAVYEAQSIGSIHVALSGLGGYICSEYFDTIPNGETGPEGILCQDLQNLTFADDSFDLIITQDVFEHIREPEKAFREILRVLKPGGFHIFTIPYHENRPTLRRIIFDGANEIYQCNPVFHGDPLRKEGALVYTDYGSDISRMLENQGFVVEIIPCGIWYTPDQIPYIADEKEYQKYLDNNTAENILKYFKYNSWVFRSRKPETRVRL
jgi:SAM-dependent methyltransferase